MAYARPRAGGRWQGLYKDKSRKQHSAGVFDRKEDALAAAAALESQTRNPSMDRLLGYIEQGVQALVQNEVQSYRLAIETAIARLEAGDTLGTLKTLEGVAR